MSLLAQGRTKEKGTMARKKSSVLIAGRASTLNMPAWRRILMKQPLSLREITSIFRKDFRGEINKIGNHSMKKVMPSWHFEVQSTLDWFWSFKPHDGWKILLLIFGDRKIHPHPHGRWLHHHFRRTRYCWSRKWFFLKCVVCTISGIKSPQCLSDDTYWSS